jgi:hypothetical protein
MKYIINDPNRGWLFDPYFSYIESIRARLPAHVYDFASNYDNFNLTSHQSLHDAWLDYLTVHEPASGDRKQFREIGIECCFLGPFHDLKIFLSYEKVHAFSLTTPEGFTGPPDYATGHGDLLIHEVRLNDNGLVVHDMLFSRGSTFEIVCANLVHRTESYNA